MSGKVISYSEEYRSAVIDTLVDIDWDSIIHMDSAELLNSYLRTGFKGYDNFTDEELQSELDNRGIKIESDFYDDDGQPTEYDEWMSYDADC
jgi:hypothetical protein